MNALHPTAVLCLWASTAVVIQTMSAPWLWAGSLAASLLAVLQARTRFVRLARRIRILSAVTILLFAFATPGVRMFPAQSGVSLTWDGLVLGLEHAARLLAMVALVAVLLERLSVDQLICALHHALRGFERFGLPADRIAVRLSLVLDAMERTESGWRAWLLNAEAAAAPGVATVPVRALRFADGACIILALGLAFAWGLI